LPGVSCRTPGTTRRRAHPDPRLRYAPASASARSASWSTAAGDDADGQTQLDDFDLDSSRAIEVLRGRRRPPTASVGRGIQLFTEDAPATPGVSSRTSGLVRVAQDRAQGGAHGDGADLFVQGSYFSVAGYRDHRSRTTAS